MAVHVNLLMRSNISIKFKFQIQIVKLGPAVNRQPGFCQGLVEQSNAEENNPVGLLADWLLARAVSAGLAWVPG